LWFRPANIREKLTCPATILLQKALLGVLSLLAPVGMACGCRARYSKYGGPEELAGSEEVPSPVASGTRMGGVAAATVLAVLFALLLLWRRRASTRLVRSPRPEILLDLCYAPSDSGGDPKVFLMAHGGDHKVSEAVSTIDR